MKDIPDITVGTHYYRQPTPLPAEWERDLAAIKRMGMDLIQLRPQWRWHERNEGELDFGDLDRLFDLAADAGLKILFKFYLPCAPQWLFDNHDACRVRTDGSVMHPVTSGSIYVGGFAPCFDKELVRRKAARFVRAAVQRYRDRPNLLAWHAWNEPRSRPAVECACADSMDKYRAWLAGRFGTIEQLNDFAGLAVSGRGADFSGVKPPVAAGDYIGWLLFRSFRVDMIADRLAWMAGLIRKGDPTRPVISHAGFCSVLQDALEDTSNDYLNSRPFDMYGSSCPTRPDDLPELAARPVAYQAATVDLICSRLRGVNQPFWANEIYGNFGMYQPPAPPSYFRQTTYGAVAAGAKGIIYWQYRSERLTSESNDAGLTTIAGEPTPRSREVARITKVLKRRQKLLGPAGPAPATVGILYDYSSDLISRIETAAPGPVDVPQGLRLVYPYKASLRGIHLALWELDIPADVVPSEEFDRLMEYPVAYLPCPRMLPAGKARELTHYVRHGGVLISEPSPAMREPNGWVSPHVPPAEWARLFGARESARVKLDRRRTLTTRHGRIACPPDVFLTTLEPAKGADVDGAWGRDGAGVVSRAIGKGRAILLGAPLGEVYFHTRGKAVLGWIKGALAREKVAVESVLERTRADLRVRRLLRPDGSEIVFLFNFAAKAAVAIRARGSKRIRELSDLGVKFRKGGGCFRTTVPAEEVLIVHLSQ